MEIENASRFPVNENDFSDMVDKFDISCFAKAIIRNSKFKVYSGRYVYIMLPYTNESEMEDNPVFGDILKVLEEYFKFTVNLRIYYSGGEELRKW